MRRLILPLLSVAYLFGGPNERPSAARAEEASPPRLDVPLACSLGRDCWIQHYVDRDASPAARDYTCGGLTYEGHNGTDFRIPDMAAERAGVNVLAAAAGKVLRLRDGVEDISVRVNGVKSVEGQECGNGLVIDHGGGLETQYCHMAKGSVLVKAGDMVRSGQVLGHVGLSGETEFPHLHFTVRQNGVVVDPFAPGPAAGGSCGSGQSLWRQTPPYVARSIINAGFTAKAVDMAAIEAGGLAPPDRAASYIVAYVRIIGLRAGDQPSLILFGPAGETLAPSPPVVIEKSEPQRFVFVGKRRPQEGWPAGVYRARYTVHAGGKLVLQRDFKVAITG